MSWISIIIYVVTNLPQFIALIKQVLALVHGLPNGAASGLKDALAGAIETHKQTGDDSEFKKVCDGIMCPAAPVKE